jgi:hypothetical protein
MRRIALALVVALAGCSRTTEDVLPWFRVRTTEIGVSQGIFTKSRETIYLVRHGVYGWHELPERGLGHPVVLDPQAVMFGASGESRIIYEGQTASVPACPDDGPAGSARRVVAPAVSMPPLPARYDCSENVEGPARGIATTVRLRRYDAKRQLVFEARASTNRSNLVFGRPMVAFYDASGLAYFLLIDRDSTRHGCTLAAVDHAGMRIVARRDDLPVGQCWDAPNWAGGGRPPLVPEGRRASPRGS